VDHRRDRGADDEAAQGRLRPPPVGVHYTPDDLADELVAVAFEPHLPWEPALDWLPGGARYLLSLNVVDLACGDGALLAAAVRYLTPLLIRAMVADGVLLTPNQAARLIQRCCIIGNDVDPQAVAAARRRLPKASIDVGDGLFDVDIDPQGGPLVFIGNPPFLGGTKISGALGADYRKRLETFPSFKGRADLCAAFFIRAADIIHRSGVDGTISFIATKTIAEGDTRKAALEVLLQPNDLGVWTIWNAWPRRPWPGKAKVHIAIVHMMHERTGRRRGFAEAIDRVYQQWQAP
jgi:predicted RNA methylase